MVNIKYISGQALVYDNLLFIKEEEECTTFKTSKLLASIIDDYLSNKGLEPKDVVNSYEKLSDGSFSFQTGVGYEFISSDLLGTRADGKEAKKLFEYIEQNLNQQVKENEYEK